MEVYGIMLVRLIVLVSHPYMGQCPKRITLLRRHCTKTEAKGMLDTFLQNNKFTMCKERLEASWQADAENLPLTRYGRELEE